MKGPLRVYYDDEGDFLEISVGQQTKSYAIEVERGIFVRKDEKTNEVKSVGILGFKQRAKTLQGIEWHLPIDVTFSV